MAKSLVKRCSKCDEVKPLEEFYANLDSPDGKRSDCRTCNIKKSAMYFKTHPRRNEAIAQRFSKLKNHAKAYGKVCTISRELYESLIARPCHYCGGELNKTSHGLDRVDNDRGYEPDNVVPCCWRCNSLKQHRPYTWMIKYMERKNADLCLA